MLATSYPREIRRIQLIDDDPEVRSSYGMIVEDAGLIPVDVPSIKSIKELIGSIDTYCDGVICDYQLKSRSTYSQIDGHEVVESLYKAGIPVLLCTRYFPPNSAILSKRRHIPALLSSGDLATKMLPALQMCAEEQRGSFTLERKPWKTLIRVEGAEQVSSDVIRFHVVVPGWHPSQGVDVELKISEVPIAKTIRELCQSGECRVRAHVNIGANQAEDLYFENWSLT